MLDNLYKYHRLEASGTLAQLPSLSLPRLETRLRVSLNKHMRANYKSTIFVIRVASWRVVLARFALISVIFLHAECELDSCQERSLQNKKNPVRTLFCILLHILIPIINFYDERVVDRDIYFRPWRNMHMLRSLLYVIPS